MSRLKKMGKMICCDDLAIPFWSILVGTCWRNERTKVRLWWRAWTEKKIIRVRNRNNRDNESGNQCFPFSRTAGAGCRRRGTSAAPLVARNPPRRPSRTPPMPAITDAALSTRYGTGFPTPVRRQATGRIRSKVFIVRSNRLPSSERLFFVSRLSEVSGIWFGAGPWDEKVFFTPCQVADSRLDTIWSGEGSGLDCWKIQFEFPWNRVPWNKSPFHSKISSEIEPKH